MFVLKYNYLNYSSYELVVVPGCTCASYARARGGTRYHASWVRAEHLFQDQTQIMHTVYLPRRASCGAFGQGYELAGNRAARLPHAQQTRTWPRAERPYLARLGRFLAAHFPRLAKFLRWVTVEALCLTHLPTAKVCHVQVANGAAAGAERDLPQGCHIRSVEYIL